MSQSLESLQQKIQWHIDHLDLSADPPELYVPVEYCLKNGGKRMRPLMTLVGCEMFGGDIEQAVSPAIGLELFHNFTLMHDDIMDNAPLRRGKPTVHSRWNANTAILSGDVMFALAYSYMLKVPEVHLRRILDLFNQTVIAVCEGQQYDMNFETVDTISEKDYLNMIRLKTAVLPAACLKTGAIVANAPEEDVQHLYLFGELIGLAFQLKDDWLDVFGDETVFGKRTGGDIVANKKTWLYIKAFELADKEQLQTLEDAFTNRISNMEEKISVVKGIYTRLNINTMALDQMEKYYSKAFDHLEKINLPDRAKANLTALAKNLFDRTV